MQRVDLNFIITIIKYFGQSIPNFMGNGYMKITLHDVRRHGH